MAKTNLASTTSIVDFLKSQGKESSFSARRKLFNEKGFEDRLGTFTGGASQNLALLKGLRSETQPSNVVETASAIGGGEPSAPQFTTPSGAKVDAQGGLVTQPAEQPATQTVDASSKAKLPEIPEVPVVSAADILKRARSGTGVQIAEEEAQVKKQRIEQSIPSAISDVKSEFASRGLVFSGARSVAEQQVRDEALSKQLDVDISFAKILGGAIDKAETDLGKEFEEVVADAKERRTEAIALLKSAGLTIDPFSGELTPTLSAITEQRLRDKFSFDVAKEASKAFEELTVSEAKALGVPFGTTRLEAVGITPQKDKSIAEQLAEILSPAEAEKFGVPFGTTKSDVVGLSPLGTSARSQLATFASAQEIVTQIGDLSTILNVARDPFAAFAQGVRLEAESFAKTDADAALFKDKKEGLLSLLTRALGEKGVLTDQDISRVRKLLPVFRDTREIAERKIADLKSFITEVNDKVLQSLTSPIEGGEIQGGGLGVGSSGQTSSGINYTIEE